MVSVAWLPDEVLRDEDRLHEAIETGEGVISIAWPFAQGRLGKPEDTGVMTLFEQGDPNLPESEWVALLDWLSQRRIVMQNAKYDVTMLRTGTVARPGVGVPSWPGRDLLGRVVWDTQLVNRELDPLEGTSLKPTAERLWGVGQADEQRILKRHLGPATNPRFDLVDLDIIAPYAAKDAELTLRLYYHQLRRIEQGEGRRDWIDRELELMRLLYRIETRGLVFDPEAARQASKTLAAKQRELAKTLPFRPNTPAAKKYFFGPRPRGLELVPYATTDGGDPQLTAEILERMVADRVPLAVQWRDWNKIATARSRWYDGWAELVGPDGRLRASFRQAHVVSTRLSVERVQLQAIPASYKLKGGILDGVPTPRELIGQAVARTMGPDWVKLETDLAQAELRVAALYARCERMLSAFAEGRDLHGETATELFGVRDGDREWTKMRQVGKRGNFSLVFGIGWVKLQADIREQTGVELGEVETQRLVRDWNRLYPEYQRAIQRHMRQAEMVGRIRLANGKHRWFPQQGGNGKPVNYHSAFNQRVQPSLAQFAADWWLGIDRELERWAREDSWPDGTGLVMVIHDSAVTLIPRQRQAEYGRWVQGWTEQLWSRYFPGVGGGCETKEWEGQPVGGLTGSKPGA